MKRVIILSLCLLLTMAVRSQSWRTNADAFIVNQLFVNNVGHVDIYAFPELLYGSDYVFSIDGDTILIGPILANTALLMRQIIILL